MDTQEKAREQKKYIAPGLTGTVFFIPEIGPDGKPKGSVKGGWDLSTNKKI